MQKSINNLSFLKLFFIYSLIVLSVSCTDESTSPLLGRYRLQLADSLQNPHFPLQQASLNIQKHNKIIYDSKINNKPKFHFEGTYNLNVETNELNIVWQSGKLPEKLIIEKKENNYTILVGNSLYVKENK